jgi:hypothetical protein
MISDVIKRLIEEYEIDHSTIIYSDSVIDDCKFRIAYNNVRDGNNLSCAKGYIDEHLASEGEGVRRFIYLLAFLKGFRKKQTIPNVTPREYDERTTREIQDAIELIREPMLTYKDFMERITLADEKLAPMYKRLGCNYKIIDQETFDGFESADGGKKTISGKRPNYDEQTYRIIENCGKGVWQLFSLERGTQRMEIRIYGESYLYDYLLNLHIDAFI